MAWNGPGWTPAFPERVDALLTAFALHAASAESAVNDVVEALAAGMADKGTEKG